MIERAAALLRAGKLVAFPTETVYGLGADATNEEAVRRIFAVKNRPHQHPLIVHVANSAALSDWAIAIPPAAYLLAEAFWPGPLTLILQKQPHVSPLVTGGQSTIALRVPRHPIAQALLQAFGGGIAAPSANQFTHVSPTTAEAVSEELAEGVDLVLDGGLCEVGLESTILDLSTQVPTILRPGMIMAPMIEAVLKQPVKCYLKKAAQIVPGSHLVHYAPMTPTQLLSHAEIISWSKSVSKLPAVILTHVANDYSLPDKIHCVKMPETAAEYAHILYHTLRELDRAHFQQIIIEEVPHSEEWEAVRDRLTKASGRHYVD